MSQVAVESTVLAPEASKSTTPAQPRQFSQHVGRWRERQLRQREEARAAATLATSVTDEVR